MRIKTNLVALAFLFALTTSTAAASNAIAVNNPEKVELTAEQQARIDALKRRVVEIKGIDRSKLTKQERKDLRAELKEMNNEAKAIQGRGVYLSVGAIIIVILLLILLL
ncbi:MAG: hypothetical protein ACR2KB_07690 [Chitinophagaceae bacterium]|jgi:Skp family chaperone for outer membrane proteins